MPSSPVANHSSSRSSTINSKSSSLHKHSSAGTPNTQVTSHPSSPTATLPNHDSLDSTMGNEHSKHRSKDHHEDEKKRSKHKTTPVKVPRGADPRRQRGPDSQFEPSGPPRDPNHIPHSNFGLPPRLPLPIGEEPYTPGSPILDAQGAIALHEDDVDGILPRQSSTISNTTIEDDELGNELTGLGDSYQDGRATVPTWLYWKHGGEKVYVTGTFTNWSRKYRMDRDPATGFLATLLQLPPGTHHVKFIVDGEMQLARELPTAADYTNILVNYIEVSADDLPQPEEKAPEGIFPPQLLPEGTEAKDHAPASIGKSQLPEEEVKAEPVFWGKELPPYLHDDKDEHPNRFQRYSRTVEKFPDPPGLPLFLGKSILNGTTPMKDDSSVLNMPNHTILNHLATSSIKNNVLATSITTRYIRKYVTTIVYKPTEEA